MVERTKLIRAVIFDVGGVLHGDYSRYVQADIKFTLGVDDTTFQKYFPPLYEKLHLGEITEKEFWDEFTNLTGTRDKLPPVSMWQREYRNHYKIDEDMMELVRQLKKKGLLVAIVSNSNEPHYRSNMEYNLYKEFEIIILSHQVGLAKPNPKIFELVLEKLGTNPEETIFIDDKPDYAAASETLGIHGLVFTGIEKFKGDLAAFGVNLDAQA